jgi:hypothetical protein
MPEVCLLVGTPGLQPQSWINENKNSFTITTYKFIASS